MIQIPTTCPTCNSNLEMVNEQLFCRNKECSAQTLKKIQHYCKVMKIKGMGEKTLEKLDFEKVHDLYDFSVHYYVDALGDTMGNKLFKEVQQSKTIPLNVGLAAFSIPLIGETASKKLGTVCKTIDDISKESCKQAGLGEKATANLLEWIDSQEYVGLPINLTFEEQTASETSKNISVCITGKLLNFKNRSDAAKYLESLGFTITDSVTKTTNILIDEEGKASSKREKAEKLNIPIITIEELIKEYK